MRRIIALALTVVFSLQTTASAAVPGQMHGPNVQPLLSAIENTFVFALITGKASRYEAMHAPAPTIPKLHDDHVRPDMSRARFAQVRVRPGVAMDLSSKLPHRRFNRKDALPDPLVLPKTAKKPIPANLHASNLVRPRTAQTGGSTLPASTTGINRWWEYAEKAIPGVGKAMVNVANGNLIVQADDVDVPERGVDLAFRRTYNSQSMHDASNSDGSSPAVFGNGWTNTFDAHLAYNAAANTMSVYDIDGARYDYVANPSGCSVQTAVTCWTPPPGMQGTTFFFGPSGVYWWTKKNGTTYEFFAPDIATTWGPQYAAYAGLVVGIYGRNSNNAVTFHYSWNGGAASVSNLTGIVAEHSDGQSISLTFGLVNGTGPLELSSLTRPDGQVITYGYDANGDLLSVTRPGNATDDATRTQTITSLTERYWYYSGSHAMQWVAGPRYMAGSSNNGNTSTDGSTYEFSYSANTTSGQLTWISDYGLVNFTPNDGTGAPLQSGSTSPNSLYRQESFTYVSAETQLSDTDGHATRWWYDGSGRVTSAARYTGSGYNWLVTQAAWDATNDLTASVDPRGNETDYAYDSYGNTVAVAAPQVSTSAGTLRPTSTYTYDANNNLLSYCDAVYNEGNSWSSPSNAPPVCPASGAGAFTAYFWNTTDPAEPFGYLTDTYTPMGYHQVISYNQSAEGGDFGLPTQVNAAVAIAQNDGTTRTPTETFGYDPYGNLASYNKGNGAWTMTYDSLNRVTSRQDPDRVTSYTCYNTDGTVSLQRTASQYAADGSAACGNIVPANSAGVSYAFDPDGNTLTEQQHHGCAALSNCQAGVTTKWYDGEDRLVEVRQPQDGNDAYAFPWMTRYIYDISGGQPQSITGGQAGFYAYGGLYKTQECVQGTSVQIHGTIQASPPPVSNTPTAPTYTGGCSFQDLRGNTFDALDRSLTKDEVAAGTTPEQTTTYDCNGEYGLACTKTNPLNQQDTLTYDADGNLASETFSDGVTPNRSYSYDPDGHTTSLTSSTLGTATRTYDANGRLWTSSDSSGELDPGTITYSYYGDGLRSSLSLAIPALSFSKSNLFTYSYRPDGERSSLVNALGTSNAGGTGTFAWTYSNAGRETSQTDPFTGATAGASYTLVPKSLTYDSYGRVSGMMLPRNANAYSGFSYDLDDGVLAYSINGVRPCCWYQLSTRNELPGSNAVQGQYANGASCTIASGQSGGQCTYDARSGQMLAQQQPYGLNNTIAGHAYTYDSAGRQTSDTASCGGSAQGTATRTYDTDNHIIGQSIPQMFDPGFSCGSVANQTAINYTWSADGHLANYTNTQYQNGTPYAANYSAHWDGDDLLYVALNGLIFLYVEKLGVMLGQSNGSWSTMVYDRDWTGTSVNSHFWLYGTTYGFGFLTADNVHTFLSQCKGYAPLMGSSGSCSQSQFPPAPSAGGPSGTNSEDWSSTPPLDASREDGYFDGSVSFQGVRAYDPNMNQWTTPDAYSGDVHDPMSQHPYMWNDNNPVQYSDPSGYLVPLPPGTGEALLRDLASLAKAIWDGITFSAGMRVATAPRGITSDQMFTLRSAATTKGNFSMGSSTEAQANAMGKQWVGDGAKLSSNGKALTSSDGLRTYRFPEAKSSGVASGQTQANFEWRTQPGGLPTGNGHLRVQPPPT